MSTGQSPDPWKRKEVIGDAVLYLGNSFEIVPVLDPVDAVITDPPYVLDKPSGQKIKTFVRKYWIDLYDQKLDQGFSVDFLFLAPHVVSFLSKKQIRDFIDAAETRGYYWTLLCWHKNNPAPLCGNSYLPDTEYIFHMWKDKKLCGSYKTKKKFWVSDVEKNEFDHPTVKPQFIMEPLVLNATQKGETVLDPFMGSGSTGVACMKYGRKFIGIETNEAHFELAVKRIRDARAQPDMFAGAVQTPEQPGLFGNEV